MIFRVPWSLGNFKTFQNLRKGLHGGEKNFIYITCRRHSAVTITCSTNQIKSTRKATVAFYRVQIALQTSPPPQVEERRAALQARVVAFSRQGGDVVARFGQLQAEVCPPWRQPRGKSMLHLVNSANRIGWHLWEIDL